MREKRFLEEVGKFIASHHLVNRNLLERPKLPCLWVPLSHQNSVSGLSCAGITPEDLLFQVDSLNVEFLSIIEKKARESLLLCGIR